MNKKAFTLAEVLITLGIIGIIAALTLPALIQSYQKMVFRNQYKKMYATLSNAYNKAIYDMGGVTTCFHTNLTDNKEITPSFSASNEDCKKLKPLLEENLKIAKICNTQGVKNGCLKPNQYKGMDSLLKDSGATDEEAKEKTQGCNNINENTLLNVATVYVLNDGSILIGHTSNTVPVVGVIDVNGQAGPNKWGWDVFKLALNRNGHSYIMYPSGCSATDKGGISSYQMYLNTLLNINSN